MATTSQNSEVYDVLPQRKGGACKTPKDGSYYGRPIQHAKGDLAGFSRIAGDVSAEVRRAIIDLIIDESVRRGHAIRDIAYILLIARFESSFNLDAATCGGSASGVMQITNVTATDIAEVTKSQDWRKKNPQDIGIDVTKADDRFNARKNIMAGIIQYERCKEKALLVLNTSDRSIYESRIYQYYHAGLYFDGKNSPNPKKIDLYGLEKFNEQILPFLNAVEAALKKSGKFQLRLTQPDGKPYSGVEYVALVPRKWTESKDKIFGWLAHLFEKPPVKEKNTNGNKSADPATTSTNATASALSNASAPPATSSDKKIQYPGRIKDGATFDVIQGKTDSEGMTAEIPVKGVSEVYMCILEYDYDNKATNLQRQREENKDRHSDGSNENGDDDESSENPVAQNADTSTPKTSAKESEGNDSGAGDDVLKVESIEQYSPRRLSAMYCDRKPNIEKIAQGFRQIGKPFETELLEFSRSYIVKPSQAIDAVVPTMAEPSKPVQVEQISASLKKEQAKESTNPVATVNTKPDNPNALTQGRRETPWMDIAIKERFQQEVPGTVGATQEGKTLQGKIKGLAAENKKLKEKIRAERQLGNRKMDLGKINGWQKEFDKNKSNIDDLFLQLVKLEKDKSINNPRVIEYLESTDVVAAMHLQAKAANDEIAWCAAFVNWCMAQTKYGGLSKGSAARAANWEAYGKEANIGDFGAIVVVEKNKTSASGAQTPSNKHVGFLWMEGKNERGIEVIRLLGGNQTFDIGTENSGPKKNWSRSKVGRVTVGEFPKNDWLVVARRLPLLDEKK